MINKQSLLFFVKNQDRKHSLNKKNSTFSPGYLNNLGFTLIEILVVIGIMSIISAITIANFADFSRRQTVTNAALEIMTILQTARSKTQSQVKPVGDNCNNKALNGYKVVIYKGIGNDYFSIDFLPRCDDTDIVEDKETKNLPRNISIAGTTSLTFFFPVLTGTIEGDADPLGKEVVVTGFGFNKILKIYSDGRITSL